MTERSPTPWPKPEHENSDTSSAEWWAIEGVAGHIGREADAAFIVHAVNLHDEMVEALRGVEQFLVRQREVIGPSPNSNLMLSKIRSALSKSTPTQEGE